MPASNGPAAPCQAGVVSRSVEIGNDGKRIENALGRSGTAKRKRQQELPGEQPHRAMPPDQFGRAVDRLGTDEDIRLRDRGAEPSPVERADPRKGVDTLGVCVDQHAAAIGQGAKVPLHFAHRPDRFVARPVFRPPRHAAEQLVEYGERGVGQAFLEADGCGR